MQLGLYDAYSLHSVTRSLVTYVQCLTHFGVCYFVSMFCHNIFLAPVFDYSRVLANSVVYSIFPIVSL